MAGESRAVLNTLMKPYVMIEKLTISEAWETAVRQVWNFGRDSKHYGREMVATIVVEEPFREPRVHKGDWLIAVQGTLEKYYDEVIEGTMDHAIAEGKQPYTYHQRLFNYPIDNNTVNQILLMLEGLLTDIEKGDITNRNEAITWNPHLDPLTDSPPCLQYVWGKLDDKGSYEMHTTWRSRDCFKAMHMNMLAMTILQKRIAKELHVPVGAYVDFSNSLHIYEKDWETVERFLKTVERRKI
jgi:thymidylate synthase (methanogen type)